MSISLASQEWQEKALDDPGLRYGRRSWVDPLLPSGHGFVCFNVDSSQLYLIKADGSPWAGPYMLPLSLVSSLRDRFEMRLSDESTDVVFWGEPPRQGHVTSCLPPTREEQFFNANSRPCTSFFYLTRQR